ncbi:MAG TPA: 4Fe-4S dicluster domain-containing protein [Clostridia bacterium]|nr:4Fe-4S dicluster domain-containing protein [Clostridia bacterium]
MNENRIVWLNHDKCSGCSMCELVCSYSKMGIFNPEDSRISTIERDMEGSVQIICRNCEEAPCIDACPAGALYRRIEDHFVVLNETKCVGCNMCVMLCPFNAIGIEDHYNVKCDTCCGAEKCAQICERGAIEFMDYSKAGKSKRREYMKRLLSEQEI